jgi:hypothetical protein
MVTPRRRAQDDHVAEVLAPRFIDLQASQQPHQRGPQFEELLRILFVLNGYETERNSAVASPRQTDLLARKNSARYLIESKWQRDAIDINDLDSLRSRLDRAPTGTIGCFFAMSPFSQSAIDEIRSLKRSAHGGHQILLIGAVEVTALFRGEVLLDHVLHRKLIALRDRAEVLVDAPETEPRELCPLDIPLPVPLVDPRAACVESRGGRAYDVAFGEIPAVFERISNVGAFELHGTVPEFATHDELLAALQILHSHLRLGGRGGYTLTQLGSDRMWFGTSPTEMVRRLANSSERYADANVRELHHSEEFVFCDSTRFGLLFVSGRRLLSTGRIYSVSFEMRLAGVPFDLAPIQSVADALQLHWDELLPVEGPVRIDCTPRPLLAVEPLEYLEARESGFLNAAIVTNPWSGETDRVIPEVGSASVLVGRLGDWLAPHERVRAFQLLHFQFIRFRSGVVVDVMLNHDETTRIAKT